MQRLIISVALVASAWGAVAALDVPPPLAAETGTAARRIGATGVQIYTCKAGEAGAAPRWDFVAPRADLFDESGAPFGTHGAGPFWQALDGSRIVGRVTARADAPRAGAIPWLLLATRPDGATAGLLTGVTQIQRVDTEGGIAPAGGCDAAAIGRSVEVPYRAEYRLFSAAH
jgi:hypothetical protein